MNGYLYKYRADIRDFTADEIVKSYVQTFHSSAYDKPIIHQPMCNHFDVKRL